MSICKIGETKMIPGVGLCRKEKARTEHSCDGCHFLSKVCPNGDAPELISASIEDGGQECEGSIWILVKSETKPTIADVRAKINEALEMLRRLEA